MRQIEVRPNIILILSSKEDVDMTNQVLKHALAAIFGLGIALSATAVSADTDHDFVDNGVPTLSDKNLIFAGDGKDSGPE